VREAEEEGERRVREAEEAAARAAKAHAAGGVGAESMNRELETVRAQVPPSAA